MPRRSVSLLDLVAARFLGQRPEFLGRRELMGPALPTRDVALGVPHVETLDVELQSALGEVCGHAFHHELERPDFFVAGIADLAVTGATPDSGDAVLRQATIGELLANEVAERYGFHGRNGTPLATAELVDLRPTPRSGGYLCSERTCPKTQGASPACRAKPAKPPSG